MKIPKPPKPPKTLKKKGRPKTRSNGRASEIIDSLIRACGTRDDIAFAELIGVHPLSVYGWRNKERLSEPTIKRLTSVLGVNPAYLRYADDEMFVPSVRSVLTAFVKSLSPDECQSVMEIAVQLLCEDR